MSVTLLQHDEYFAGNAGNQVLFGSLSAGSTVLILIGRAFGTGTITGVSDAVNGAYTPLFAAGDRYAYIKQNISAVTGSVTAVSSDGVASGFLSQGYELTGADTGATSDSITEGSVTTHAMAGTGLSGTGFFAGVANFSSVVNWTPGSGWTTFVQSTSAGGAIQHKIETGASETGPYTTATGTSTDAFLVFIPESSITPPTTLTWLPRQHILRGPRGLMTPSGPVPPTRPEP